MSQTLFISYSWSNTKIADEIDTAFQPTGIYIKRDIREIKYKGSIKDYMKQVRDTDFVLIIISDSFLKSPNCMFEALELLKEKEFSKKILPVIIDETKIYKANERLNYLQFWTDKCSELKRQLAEFSPTDSIELWEELKHFENIRGSIISFLSLLSDMNSPPYSKLKNDKFKSIFSYIGVSESALIEMILSLKDLESTEDVDIKLDQIEADFPNNSKVYFTKAFYAYSEDKIKKSSHYYKKSIDLDPTFSPSYFNLACNFDSFDKDKDYDEARRLYEKAIELEPDSSRAYVNLGKLYSQHYEKPEKARELYELALTVDPNSVSAHFNLAGILVETFEDIKGAKKHYELTLKIDPNSVAAKYYYAILLWEKFENYLEAKEQLLEILAIEPNSRDALRKIAYLLEVVYKHYNTAEAYYAKLIEVLPVTANDHYLYATFLMIHFLGEKALARKHYDLACSIDESYKSDNAEILINRMRD